MAEIIWNRGSGNNVFQIPTIKKPPAKLVWAILIGVMAVVLLSTSYYQIEPAEVGVIQRFGKFVRIAEPGPHIKFPFGIETVTQVPVQRQLKEEFGFRTAEAGVSTTYH